MPLRLVTVLGVLLSQEFKGEVYAVLYVSKKLSNSQKYAAIGREAIAIKWSIEELKYYLKGTLSCCDGRLKASASLHWTAPPSNITKRIHRPFSILDRFSACRGEVEHPN